MKHPSKITVASVTIPISAFPSAFGDEDCGQFEEKTSSIHLSRGLSPDVERMTLLHEMLHALVFHGGLRDDMKEKESEERVCNVLALLLFDVLRKNPGLVKYLTT